jgi:hypothetical protein
MPLWNSGLYLFECYSDRAYLIAERHPCHVVSLASVANAAQPQARSRCGCPMPLVIPRVGRCDLELIRNVVHRHISDGTDGDAREQSANRTIKERKSPSSDRRIHSEPGTRFTFSCIGGGRSLPARVRHSKGMVRLTTCLNRDRQHRFGLRALRAPVAPAVYRSAVRVGVVLAMTGAMLGGFT